MKRIMILNKSDMLLFEACENGNINLVKDLINNNIDINICNKNNDTLLLVACKNNQNEIIKLLIYCNADLNYENNNNTALSICLKKNNSEIIYELIKYGANVNYINKLKESCLSIAILCCNLNVIEIILSLSNINIILDVINTYFSENSNCNYQNYILKLLLNHYFNIFFKMNPNSYINDI